MSRNIAVPAEVARKLALNVGPEVDRLRNKGHKATASHVQRYAAEALDASKRKDGEFVSLSARAVSSLAAHSVTNVDSQYTDAAEHFLHQYGVWNER